MQPRLDHTKSDTMRSIYMMGFVFSMALALPLYINSSFLNEFLSDKSIGLMYTLGSIISFFLLIAMPKILSKFGNYKTTLTFTVVSAALMFALAYFTNLYIVAPVFVLYLALLTLILFNFDIFLEKYSSESETGGIRGTFLTITNLAILASPVIAGAILTNGDYWKIYLVGAIFMSGLILLLTLNFKDFEDPKYEQVPFMSTAKEVWKDRGMRSVFAANLLLRFFYAWMTIYTPLYLHEHIGFEWAQIGIIFTIMLIPFVLFEIPAGKLADTKFGEKEMLGLGFVIMAISTASLMFISEPIFWLWALVLFITRIGASMVEIMTETHFFKHVDGADTHIIGFFRNNRPIAYTVAPLFASAVLVFAEFNHLFLILGIIMLLGICFTMFLEDTK